ncbi:hypothetical protein CVD28_03270 [Bacillus sp. M6-12]|uniref:hypothetical protein n=1 Tax=Bacillus sp. M6-12 TaxID=2054166 RepID=UPI000C78282E|nr:hypothetical protein [Bacillus sp. M6-12]PLS19450.1 hypothetical protein CVD28_03270 [Bacillus sp. M6-12]
MKSRQKKHLQKIIKRSPIVSFSQDDKFQIGDIVSKQDFSQACGLDDEFITTTSFKIAKEDMYSDLIMFVDNYLVSGGHQFVYLLLPTTEGKYRIVEKERKAEWQDKYWKKEDPDNQRDWCYFDEDINDLFDYIMKKFDKYNK